MTNKNASIASVLRGVLPAIGRSPVAQRLGQSSIAKMMGSGFGIGAGFGGLETAATPEAHWGDIPKNMLRSGTQMGIMYPFLSGGGMLGGKAVSKLTGKESGPLSWLGKGVGMLGGGMLGQIPATMAQPEFWRPEPMPDFRARGPANIGLSVTPEMRQLLGSIPQSSIPADFRDIANQIIQSDQDQLNLTLNPEQLIAAQTALQQAQRNPLLRLHPTASGVIQELNTQLNSALEAQQPTFLSGMLLPENELQQSMDNVQQLLATLDSGQYANINEVLKANPQAPDQLQAIMNHALASKAQKLTQQGIPPGQALMMAAGGATAVATGSGEQTLSEWPDMYEQFKQETGAGDSPQVVNKFFEFISQATPWQKAALAVGIPLAVAGLAGALFGENKLLGAMAGVAGVGLAAYGSGMLNNMGTGATPSADATPNVGAAPIAM